MQNFIKWLYRRFVDHGPEDLIREELGIHMTTLDLTKYDRNHREEILRQCYTMYKMEAFHLIFEHCVAGQKNYTMLYAETDKQLDAGRFSINGVKEFRDKVEGLHSKYVDMTKPQEIKNPHRVL